MRTILLITLALCFITPICYANRNPISVKPLDQQIEMYQKNATSNPKNISNLNRLSYAYIQKGRQTADASYSVRAEQLLNQALKIDPKNYESLYYLALVQMSQHRFADAKKSALSAISMQPSNSDAYGALGDATYELGQYDECASAYQKMLDRRPSTASYSRAAYYRKLIGDVAGAADLLKRAYELADYNDPENRAWCLFQLGNLAFGAGKLDEAEKLFSMAVEIFPNYYNALAGLGKVNAALDKIENSINYYNKAIAIVPMPEFVSALGDVLTAAGRSQEAKHQYDLVEFIGSLSKINQEIYNRQLALFYADHVEQKRAEALQMAEQELNFRKDIYGYDTYAWCLFRNGRYREAAESMQHALKMKTPDALLYFHAGMISSALNRNVAARSYFHKALDINPHFHPLFAKIAREKLR
ncbi:tetratricopeptide repeat protein [bacterium]|nr:tetratricopeptide repeat protein [bacterium]